MYYLLHRFGQQSNIITIARYKSKELELTRPALVSALRVVIERHPALACVWVRRPSPKKGKTRLDRALLRKVDVSSCIEFLDQESFEPRNIEDLHNDWWAQTDEDASHPWFKVAATTGGEVAFVIHHSVGDGMASYVFHRELLDVLNTMQWPEAPISAESNIIAFDPSTVSLPPDPLATNKGWKDIFWPLLGMIWFHYLPRLLPTWFFFTDLPKPKPLIKDVSQIGDESVRAVTRVHRYRIPAEKMDQIIVACRANNATLTPLLTVTWMISLTVDFYPDAHIAFSRFACALRQYIPEMEGGTRAGTIGLATSGQQYAHLASSYRRTVLSNGNHKAPTKFDVAAVWKLVREYKEKIPPSAADGLLGRWRSVTLMSEDLETQIDMSYGMFGVQPLTPHVSNLGILNPHLPGESAEEIKAKKWEIDDAQFSVACTNGYIGSICPILSVAGTKGGDTVINASYEESAYPDPEDVEMMIAKLMDKIYSLVEST